MARSPTDRLDRTDHGTDPAINTAPFSDDPTGGRRLSRRLRVALPLALLIGGAVGAPVAVVASDWRVALWIALAAAFFAGLFAAAIEDGRVQRRVDAQVRRRARPSTSLRERDRERAGLSDRWPGEGPREHDDPRSGSR
jgi:hypothetical protein